MGFGNTIKIYQKINPALVSCCYLYLALRLYFIFVRNSLTSTTSTGKVTSSG